MQRQHLFALFALLFAPAVSSHAQAIPTATRVPVQVGAAFSFAAPDYGNTYIKGFTAYGDLGLPRRFSLEVNVHDDSILTPTDIGETTFMVGPRYSVLRQGRLDAYIKVMGGIGRFSYQSGTYPNPHTDSYGVLALGGGIEFRATPHLNIRPIDIDVEKWPGFPPNGLSPFVTSFGAAYIF